MRADAAAGRPTSRAVMSSALGGGWDGVFTQCVQSLSPVLFPFLTVLIRYRVLPAFGLVGIPDSLSFEEAATLPCAALSALVSSLKVFKILMHLCSCV